MAPKLLSFDQMEQGLSVPGFAGGPEDNRKRLALAKKALHLAVERELTGQQQACVELYYFQHLTQEETARRLGISKPTVCRHLQRARRRLEAVIRCAIAAAAPEE